MARSKAPVVTPGALLAELIEATQAGDTERMDALRAKLEATLPAPRPKVSPKATTKAPKRPAKKASPAKPRKARVKPQAPPEAPQGPAVASRLILPGDMNYAPPSAGVYGQVGQDGQPYMAPSLGVGGLANRGHRVGIDGRTQVEARHVSMAGERRTNNFDQWAVQNKTAVADPKTSKADKELLKRNPSRTPRPGEVGARRPVATKVLVYCGGCGRPYEVYPSEVMLLDRESEYKCDRCVRRGR